MTSSVVGSAAADEVAVAFARSLRAAGLNVPVGSVVTFAEALAATGMASREIVLWAGLTTLVCRPEDRHTYEQVFRAFWLGDASAVLVAAPPPLTIALDAGETDAGDDDDDAETTVVDEILRVTYSPVEVLHHKDFAAYSHEEFAEARRLMADLRLAGALRRSRRRIASRRGSRPDLRRTVRRALRTGGEAVRPAYAGPSRRPRRVVLLVDVSGSMEPYARALLRFLHAAVAGGRRIDAFAVGTRLTRLTRELSSRDPDAALEAATRAVVDWSGGTRLGEALQTFNDRWGVRGMARGAVVVVLSDGWDRGDPELLATEMARLSRVAHKIVWVNPLKASEGYAPLARGMAAALPHVDEFVEGHSLAALERVAEVIRS